MALIPTIQQIYNNIAQDLRNKLDLSNDDLRKVLDALALSLAGQLKLTYLFLSDIQNNIFPDTADTSENGGTLDRMGLIWLNRIRRPSTTGTYLVSVTCEENSVLRQGITFKSNDESLNPGILLVLDNETVLTGSDDEISIRTLKGGIDNLLQVGDTLTITEPVLGVEKIVTITEVTQQPLAAETVSDFRAAILRAIQLEPQGGARTDFRLWADDAQGVRFVYPYVKNGDAGTVQVYVEATEIDSTDGNGTPSQALLNSVEEVIYFDPDITLPTNERGRLPIQANLEVLPIVPNPVDLTIIGLQNTSEEVEALLRQNLSIFLKTVRPYVAGADLSRNKNDILFSAALQSIVTDTLEPTNFFTDFIVFVNGVSQLSFEFSKENIPYLRNIIFQ